jgi:hypothetical protein
VVSGFEMRPAIYRVSLFLLEVNVVLIVTFIMIVVVELYEFTHSIEVNDGDVQVKAKPGLRV